MKKILHTNTIGDLKLVFILITLILAGISVISIIPVSAVPTTNAATSVNGTGATFNGVADIADTYWFEYSGTSGGWSMATENITSAGGAVSKTMYGIPFVSAHTYYYRFCRSGSCGVSQSFTTSVVTLVPTSTYTTQYYTPFVNAKWNMSVLAVVVPQPYIDLFGGLIWGIFWGAILMAFWVRQEDVTIPAFIYLILFAGLSLGSWLPASFVTVSWVFAAICLGAILYTLFRGRKHG